MQTGLSRTVLLVEDNPVTRLATAYELLDAGFLVVEAQDADEALAVATSDHRLDLIFTEFRLSAGLDGLALAEAVVALRPEIKVLVTLGDCKLDSRALPNAGTFMPTPYRAGQMLSIVLDQLG